MKDQQRTAALRLADALDAREPYVNGVDTASSAATILRELAAEPVAVVTECEACMTPDVCQLRGTCDHYAAEQLRVSKPLRSNV